MKECGYCNRCYDDSLRCCPHDGQALAETLSGSCLLDNKYQLESCIGRGGMGAVYRANHVHLNRPFAIKTILPEFASRDPKAADRFLQEARTAAAIQHPNVVAITDFGITSFGLFYYVMEYIEGKSLRDELHKNGAMSPERVYRVFKQVLGGVASAHHLHMVHRDLKPSNIMLTRLNTLDAADFKLIIPLNDEPEEADKGNNELAKVVDFGLAKFVNDSINRRSESSESGIVGSPLYMSPEQCDGASVDERSDIYSLGVILYHMLTGEVPFKGDSLSALLTGHLLKEPPSLRSIKAEIPEKLEKAVLKALAKNPALRHQSIAEFAEEFEAGMAIYLSPEAKMATLSIQTVPPACEVYINDEYRGRTNYQGRLVVKGLPTGNHRARITLNGYLEWSQPFTANIGDCRLEAQLQRKEDLALAAAARGTGGITKSARRVTDNFDRSSPSRPGDVSEAISYAPAPIEISAGDIVIAVFATSLTMAMGLVTRDPVAASLANSTQFPIEAIVAALAIFSVFGFTTSMIVADQIPVYRNSTMMSGLYNTASTLFLLTIILPFVAAVPMKFMMATAFEPSLLFFAIKAVIMVSCFALQSRIKRRRRVPFLG